MDDFCCTDGGKVAVALICEYELSRLRTLDACGNSGSAAVGSFIHIHVEVIVGKDGASYRRDTDNVALFQLAFLLQLFNRFGNQAVDNAVVASGTIVKRLIGRSEEHTSELQSR